MKKLFQGFKISNFIASLIIGFIYPIAKTAISENKLLVFSDTCFIISLFFIGFGVINSLYLHGDFDITSFIAKRSFTKDKKESYDEYKENINEKRKDSFNYPLFTGLLILIVSIISSRFIS